MQAVAGIGVKLVVHLESRNTDQGNKRIETGCKGRFACVKPFCFTSFLSNYLVSGNTDYFFLNPSALLDKEWHQCWRKNNGSERQWNNKPLLPSFWGAGELMRKSGESTALWSLSSYVSFLTFSTFWPNLIQQPFIEATVRIFSEPTMTLGNVDP